MTINLNEKPVQPLSGDSYTIEAVKHRNALYYVIRQPGGGIVNGHYHATRKGAERHLELIKLFCLKPVDTL